jgi:two-component system response regulator GlrR
MNAAQACLLIVDDDRNLLELMKMRLESSGYAVIAAANADEARAAVGAGDVDLAIIDLQLGSTDGITLMTELHAKQPGMPAIILTAHGSIETAVEAMRRGAFMYLTKPFDARELLLHVEHALENRRLASEVGRLRGLLGERYDFKNIIARSAAMQVVLDAVTRVAGTESTVFLAGESGTGKELIARALHLASPRREKPFVAINCAALPESILESELFGHERGSFTGAHRSTRGLFSQAHEGTLFLDEIGDMPQAVQAKLLRVLQERQFYPVGGEQPVVVDVRVITATNKNLEQEVASGKFREDLFYRIHVIPILLPPLRERKDDIPALAEHFVRKFCEAMNKKTLAISPAAMRRMLLYDWPGNVRELENAIEYAVAMASQDVLSEEMVLPSRVTESETLKPFKEAREQFEKEYLTRLLQCTQGNVSSAAELAGRYRADLYALLKKHDINPSSFKKEQN